MMDADDTLFDLLERWEEARDRGQNIPVEELCRHCPERADEVRAKLVALRASDWLRPDGGNPSVAQARVLVGRYRLGRLAGEGGYGQVWEAYDEQLHRPVAVKIPKPGRRLADRQIDQLLAEARHVARLRHAGIVTVHDVVREGAAYFTVSDFIAGETLAQHLRHGRPTVDEAVKLIAQVARILAYAHDQGVVHRDIKPANILLDSTGQPHVCDFGIAAVRADVVHASDRRATPAYASPEQLEGHPLDGRSDLWSLGVVLYEMLAGRLPFDQEDAAHLREAILRSSPPPLAAVPEAVADVCITCLAKSPAERPASGHEMAEALDAAIRGPHSPRRWRRIVGAGIGFLTVVVVSAAVAGSWSGSPKPPPPDEVDVAADAQQRATAEAVLRSGGVVRVQGHAPSVVKVENLPTGPLRVEAVDLPVGQSVDRAVLDAVLALPSVWMLNLSGTQITDDDLMAVGRATGLRRVRLNDSNATDAGVAHLAALPDLDFFELRHTQVTDAALETIQRMTKLTALELSRSRITGTGLVSWTPPPGLRMLRLNQLTVGDEAVARLAATTPKLELLELRGTRLTDAGLPSISRLGQLTWLDISNTQVSDRGLSRWTPPAGLVTLKLSGNAGVTDAGLAVFGGSKHLVRLEVRGTGVTDQGVSRLRGELPGCKISR